MSPGQLAPAGSWTPNKVSDPPEFNLVRLPGLVMAATPAVTVADAVPEDAATPPATPANRAAATTAVAMRVRTSGRAPACRIVGLCLIGIVGL